MRKAYAIILFLLLTKSHAFALVYLEYSEMMVKILHTDKTLVEQISKIINNRDVILYAGSNRKVRQAKLNNPTIGEIIECFAISRLSDNCPQNDLLERTIIDDRQYFKNIIENESEIEHTDIILTNLNNKIEELQELLKLINLPFRMYYYPPQTRTSENELFGLIRITFLKSHEFKSLIAFSPFKNSDFISCLVSCSKSRTVKFINECLKGDIPGFVPRVSIRYPNKIADPTFISCPDDHSIPTPRINKSLTEINIVTSPYQFYNMLNNNCLKYKKLPTIPLNDQLKELQYQLVIHVQRADPETFLRLPKQVRLMLLAIANKINEDDYLKTISRSIRIKIAGCK